MTGIWAAVPVKRFEGAKQRLSPLLRPAQRHALAAAMLEDTLGALAQAPLAGVMVNTGDGEAAGIASRLGARVIREDAESGHTAAVAAMARALERGCPASGSVDGRAKPGHDEGGRPKGGTNVVPAQGMLAVPADIPGATAAEFAGICQAAGPAPSFTIVPAHDRRGSNAILLCPPGVIPLRFGDDSFLPHLDAARAGGIEPRVVDVPGIALDLDQPEDVRAFLATPAAERTRAGRLLREWLSNDAAAG